MKTTQVITLLESPKDGLKFDAPPELQEVYDMVPEVRCKGLCATECTLIPVYPAEMPNLPKGTNLLQTDLGIIIEPTAQRKCPFLVSGKCSIYDKRPIVCRIYGASEAVRLVCPHGCRADKPLNEAETKTLCALVRGMDCTPTEGGAR